MASQGSGPGCSPKPTFADLIKSLRSAVWIYALCGLKGSTCSCAEHVELVLKGVDLHCQMVSAGFNFGALAGSGRSVMLVGTCSLLDTCQPARSSSSTRGCQLGRF